MVKIFLAAGPAGVAGLDRRRDCRDSAGVGDETEKGTGTDTPDASGDAHAPRALTPVPPPAPSPSPSPPSPSPSRAEPSNKLHEWGAAVLIMIVLTSFLVIVTRYLRGGGL